jgi:hypothetical protein
LPVVRVEGLDDLKRGIEAMQRELPKELAKAHKEIGKIVADEAISESPKGTHQGGGSIVPISQSIKPVASTRTVIIKAGGPATPHAAPLEFGGYIARRGFSGINRRGKRQARALLTQGARGILTHVKKQPYLFPAAEKKTDEVIDAYYDALDNLIDKFNRGG